MIRKNHSLANPFTEIFSIGILITITCTSLLGQDGPHRVYMYLDFLQVNDERSLVAELKYRPEKTFMQLSAAKVDFYQQTDTSETLIGSSHTNEAGIAKLTLTPSIFRPDTLGEIEFSAKYSGADTFRKASRSVKIRSIALTISPEIIDSVKTIQVSCHELINNISHPVDEVEVEILVTRLYSNLPITNTTVKNGKASVKFPDDLPGNHFGDLKIIGRIFEHDSYGTVEKHVDVSWGTPVSFLLEEKPRALWSRAPYWIIISMGLALGIAWYHYLLALSKLFKIRNFR